MSSRVNYYNKYFTEHHSNMKMLWTGIRSIINIKRRKFCNISQLVQNGGTVQNPKDIATILNKYFVNIAGKIGAESLEQGNPHSTIWVEKLTPHSFLSPTDSAEIETIISQLKKWKICWSIQHPM